MHSSLTDVMPSRNASELLAGVLSRFRSDVKLTFEPHPYCPQGVTINPGVMLKGGVFYGVCPGRAEFGVDMDERTFPAEARLDGSAVSFSKGCYVGQEIVARIESRGAVNRLLVQLEAEAPVEVGEEIAREGRALGSVTSAAVSPRRGPLAMGYVRSKAAEPGTELQIAGRPARIAGPPFAA